MPNHPKAEEIMYDQVEVKLSKKYFDLKKNGAEGSDVRKAYERRVRRTARKRRVSIIKYIS
jgi:hypothetical protein